LGRATASSALLREELKRFLDELLVEREDSGVAGVARKVLADRLRWLVDQGILERVPYQERPERYEYHLTRKGRDLHVALIGLRQWGDDYCSEKPPMLARTKSDKKPVIAALVPKRSDHLRLEEVEFVPGPGRGSR
jgi:DNA-binding HxlR family transcriptional regulator